MPLEFANAWMLYALWLVPIIGLIGLRHHQRGARILEQFIAPAMRRTMCSPPARQRFYWQWASLLCGCLLAIMAAARPQWGLREETVIQRGRDLIIALDVSRSMLAEDVHPNRLQRAKADIQDLLRELRGDRVALVSFRARAILLCPLTIDYAYLEQILSTLSPDSAPRGETDIGDAIQKALAAFECDQGAHQAIVLVSDGEDLAGRGRKMAEEAQKRGIVIFTVGLGDPDGATIPSPLKETEAMQYQGQEVITRLEHETLKSIAEMTGGVYVPVGTSNVKLGTLYRDHLSRIAAQDFAESTQRRYHDRFQWFLGPALIFLLGTAYLSRGRLAKTAVCVKSSSRGSSAAPAIVGLFIGLIGSSMAANVLAASNLVRPSLVTESNQAALAAGLAQAEIKALPGLAGARNGQKLYFQGKYLESAAAYLQAAQTATRQLRNDFIFNAACALYRAGHYQEAADKFNEAALRQDTSRTAAAHYNSGCACFRLAEQLTGAAASNRNYAAATGLFERAGLEFQRALRLDPQLSSARANLAGVAQILPTVRQQAKLQALLEKYGQASPDQIADEMLIAQQSILAALPAAISNASPSRIAMLEALSERQYQNSDLLIPLQASLAALAAQSASNAPTSQQIQEHLEALRNTMLQSRESLRNLDEGAYTSAAAAESGIYAFWKTLASFSQLLREDMRQQTNCIVMTEGILNSAAARERQTVLAQQEAAAQLTQLFSERFSQAVPPEGIRAPTSVGTNLSSAPASQDAIALGSLASPTNLPLAKEITPEQRRRILSLAQAAQTSQEQAGQLIASIDLAKSLTEQQEAYDLLQAIAELLPQEQSEQPVPQEQSEQPAPQDQQSEQPQERETEQQPEQSQQDQQQNEDQGSSQEAPAQQQPAKPAAPAQPPRQDEEMSLDQARALLEQAQQREKDRREEQERAHDRYIPPAPLERDW